METPSRASGEAQNAAYAPQRRRDLTDRIASCVQRAREYGEGTELATSMAISACKQIEQDAAELRALLQERAEAIKGSDRFVGGVPQW